MGENLKVGNLKVGNPVVPRVALLGVPLGVPRVAPRVVPRAVRRVVRRARSKNLQTLQIDRT